MRLLLLRARLVTLLSVLWGSFPLAAAQVEGLYEAEVPVVSREDSVRTQALGAALRSVLVKVTGERNPQSYPGVVQAMSQPSQFVDQFRYRTDALADTEDDVSDLVLWARFDSRVLDGLIRDAGLPSWGKTRPSMLMWLAVEDQSGRSLVAAEDSPTITNILHDAAQTRGLPLVLPLIDVVDRNVISVADVWAGFPDKIMQASNRYRADVVLLVRVHQPSSDEWEARWRLFVEGVAHDWSLRNQGLDVMLVAGLNRAADTVAARFSRSTTAVSGGSVDVAINDIRTLHDYARTLKYLRSLGGVSRVDVNGTLGDQLLFSLEIRGGSGALTQAVNFGGTLVPMSAGSGIQFRLLP